MCIYFFTFKSVYNEQKQPIIYVLQQFKVKSHVLLLKNIHDKLLYILKGSNMLLIGRTKCCAWVVHIYI